MIRRNEKPISRSEGSEGELAAINALLPFAHPLLFSQLQKLGGAQLSTFVGAYGFSTLRIAFEDGRVLHIECGDSPYMCVRYYPQEGNEQLNSDLSSLWTDDPGNGEFSLFSSNGNRQIMSEVCAYIACLDDPTIKSVVDQQYLAGIIEFMSGRRFILPQWQERMVAP